LHDSASEAARRGELLFRRPFPELGDRSCASCHIPSDHFIDRRRHDIGTVRAAEAHGRDGSLDTPTLLSSLYTAPYMHDGSQPTLRAVNDWFNESYRLGLSAAELGDLTAYLETVGSGVEAYEDTIHTLAAEMEEYSFFLSTLEFLDSRNERELLDLTLQTVVYEIQAHKWDVQDPTRLPVLDRLAQLLEQGRAALARGDRDTLLRSVDEYHQLYEREKEHLR
jgi:hypothetical protein